MQKWAVGMETAEVDVEVVSVAVDKEGLLRGQDT